MRKPFQMLGRILILALALSACLQPPAQPTPLLSITSLPARATDTPPPASLTLTVYYTSDEHGWMAGQFKGMGAPELMGLIDAHPASQDENVLLISGGDNWTGPAISTWFDGEGMVEVMNAMGYDAAAVGNHEFDFGLETMKKRFSEASFPYLSANIRYRSDGSYPYDLGIQPYTLLALDGLTVGIIGLTTTRTPSVTNPANVAAFDFIDYDVAIRQYAPEMRQAGADFIILAAHVCPVELNALAFMVRSQGIALMGAGHCHEDSAHKIGETVILSPGSNLGDYAFASFKLDAQTSEVVETAFDVLPNRDGQPDEQIAEIVQRWQRRADAELNVEIGYLENEISRMSLAQQALVTESWLWAYPTAQVAITNLGGLRDRLPSGALTLSHVISVLPFDNTLVSLQLSGAHLLEVLESGKSIAVGGAHVTFSGWVIERTGQELDPSATYSVLVNDFMYAGGDDFTMLAEFDPNAYFTGIDWRQPVIDWIRAQKSSSANPLDAMIAALLP